jgi:hypothetical protein
LNQTNRAAQPAPHPFSHLHTGHTETLLPPRVAPARDPCRRHALPQPGRANSGRAPDPGPRPLISSEPETVESLPPSSSPFSLPLMKPPSMALIVAGRPFSPTHSPLPLSLYKRPDIALSPSPCPNPQLTSPSPRSRRTPPFVVHRSPCAPHHPPCEPCLVGRARVARTAYAHSPLPELPRSHSSCPLRANASPR